MTVRMHTEGGVTTVTLDRPEARNALTIAMRDELVDVLRQVRNDPGTRALLLTGAGDTFSAGMDLRETTLSGGGTDLRRTSEALRQGFQLIIQELWELDKPTIAAVRGPAAAASANLAIACDFLIMASDARLIWSFTRWGLLADAGSSYLLPRALGMAKAKELILLGGQLTAEEAEQAGLATAVVPPDQVLERATSIGDELARGPTRTIGLSKRLLSRSFETSLPDLLELEAHMQALVVATEDLAEGITAFSEKRPPDYSGR